MKIWVAEMCIRKDGYGDKHEHYELDFTFEQAEGDYKYDVKRCVYQNTSKYLFSDYIPLNPEIDSYLTSFDFVMFRVGFERELTKEELKKVKEGLKREIEGYVIERFQNAYKNYRLQMDCLEGED